MEISIKCTPEEAADLVLELQGWHRNLPVNKNNVNLNNSFEFPGTVLCSNDVLENK